MRLLLSLILSFTSCAVFNKRVSTKLKTDLIKNKVIPANTKFFVTGEKACASRPSPIVFSISNEEVIAICETGLYQLDKSPFAVHVFNDDALGVQMNIVNINYYRDHVSWPLQDRYWSGLWSTDVEWLQFDSNKNTLFVQTSGPYGTGYSYLLKLPKKKILQKKCPKGTKCSDNRFWD